MWKHKHRFYSSLKLLFRYDYATALAMSMLFYEAQRSGPLPADQRVTWRGDSALSDGEDNNIDLTGGYYDGKLSFLKSYTLTMIIVVQVHVYQILVILF